MIALDAVEQRVVGTLIEKQLTTPQYYPLTTAALVAGCNQATSRDPVTSYDERTVLDALDGLRREKQIVRVIHPSHGRSVDRWRHVADEVFGLITEEVAILGVLLLRGPQTVAELRTRTERMADFEPPDTVEAILDRLAGYPEPLARNIGRQPGQSQDRWVHLLRSEKTDLAATQREVVREGAASPGEHLTEAGGGGDAALSSTTLAVVDDELAESVRALERRVAALEAEVAELREQLGG